MTDPLKRKRQAEQLLQHELIVECRDHMRDSLTKALWGRHKLSAEDRERLDALVRHYDTFWAYFERVINDGKVAELEEKQKAEAASVMQRLREKFQA